MSQGDLLIRPVTKERVRMIKRKYRKLSCPAWKVSSLPRYVKRKTKKSRIVKVCELYDIFANVHLQKLEAICDITVI